MLDQDVSANFFKLFYESGILKKILKKVQSRKNAAIVNSYFYKAVCDVENKENIYKAIILCQSLNIPGIFDSIMYTSRQFTEVCFSSFATSYMEKNTKQVMTINEGYYEGLIMILKQFYPSIKILSFQGCKFSEDQFYGILKIMALSPLRQLNFKDGAIFSANQDCQIETAKILPKLNAFNFVRSTWVNGTGQTLLGSFMKKLNISHARQLKEFSCTSASSNVPFEMIRFDKLAIQYTFPRQVRFSSTISYQFRLKELDLQNSFIMDDVMKEIVALPYLTKLSILCDGLSIKALLKLDQIKSLTDLCLKFTRKNVPPTLKATLESLNLKTVKKFSLYIPNMDVTCETLRLILNGQFTDINIITNQGSALTCIFLDTGSSLKNVSIKFINVHEDTKTRLWQNEKFAKDRVFDELESLTICNTSITLSIQFDNLIFLFSRARNIKKIHLDGFDYNEKLLYSVFMLLPNLEKLILSTLNNVTYFVIPAEIKFYISKCKNLKLMSIDCSYSNYSEIRKFPIEQRFDNHIVYRQR